MSAVLVLVLVGWLVTLQAREAAGVGRHPERRTALAATVVLSLLTAAFAVPRLAGLVT